MTDEEFKATMAPVPVRVAVDEQPPFDFWDYFDAIAQEDFNGHDFSAGTVTYAWQMPDTSYQHVLVACETRNVFLALVLNVAAYTVVGHHILDLNKVYGLS